MKRQQTWHVYLVIDKKAFMSKSYNQEHWANRHADKLEAQYKHLGYQTLVAVTPRDTPPPKRPLPVE